MKYLWLILLVGVMLLPSSPVQSDAEVVIPLTTTVIDTLQVLDAENGSVLPSGYALPNLTLNQGQFITKSLWVRNNSTSVDYTVTPLYSVNPIGVVAVGIESAKVVAHGQTVKYDFVVTGLISGSNCSVVFSFKRNQ
jgi:hypothetical protein